MVTPRSSETVRTNVDAAISASGRVVPGVDPVDVDVADLFEGTEGTEGADFSVSSSDTSVATVEITSNPRVKITPVGVGTATITVTGSGDASVQFEEGASVEFDFTVDEVPDTTPRPAAVAQSMVNTAVAATGRPAPGTDPVDVGVADLFEGTDADTRNDDFRVTSSDPGVAIVEITSDMQVRITPVGVGTATISVSTTWSTASVEFEFTVAASRPDERSPETVQSNVDAAIVAGGGLVPGRDPVNVDVDDLFTGSHGAHFRVTSSNPEVATVEITRDQRHVRVTPVGLGTATITVTMTEAGGGDRYSVEFEVTVASSVPALPLVATGLLGMLLFAAGVYRRRRR